MQSVSSKDFFFKEMELATDFQLHDKASVLILLIVFKKYFSFRLKKSSSYGSLELPSAAIYYL